MRLILRFHVFVRRGKKFESLRIGEIQVDGSLTHEIKRLLQSVINITNVVKIKIIKYPNHE